MGWSSTARVLVPVAVCGIVVAVLTGTRRQKAPSATGPESLRVKVVRSFPHDPGAFTQGLIFHEGKLYESTGLVGRSSLRRVDPATGAVEAQVPVDPTLFAEGLAAADGRLVQLTWQEGRALVWDLARFTKLGEFTYDGEGWGLCYDGRHLVMSDGSNRLVRRDVRTFDPVGEISVRDPSGPVYRLNELECVGEDTIYANVWQTSRIARIDARTGSVTAWIEAAGLLSPEEARRADVLNGIARLPSGHFVLTGKLWPRAFEVEFVAGS